MSMTGSSEPQGRAVASRGETKVTRCGWRAFEGFGRPWEAWVHAPHLVQGLLPGWASYGRCFTERGAQRRASRRLGMLQAWVCEQHHGVGEPLSDFDVCVGCGLTRTEVLAERMRG